MIDIDGDSSIEDQREIEEPEAAARILHRNQGTEKLTILRNSNRNTHPSPPTPSYMSTHCV
jgi:hypothetical protein